jgi:hypothetical protein
MTDFYACKERAIDLSEIINTKSCVNNWHNYLWTNKVKPIYDQEVITMLHVTSKLNFCSGRQYMQKQLTWALMIFVNGHYSLVLSAITFMSS